LTPEQKERGEYKIGEGIVGEVVKTGEPVIIPHISDEPRYLNKQDRQPNIRMMILSSAFRLEQKTK